MRPPQDKALGNFGAIKIQTENPSTAVQTKIYAKQEKPPIDRPELR